MGVDISICVISYNHESYIKKTLDSISSQSFQGTVEVIIGIDLSSDDTLRITRETTANYKWPVQVIGYESRQGMFNNLFNVFYLAKGKFIAILEGDDFWIDKEKLKKQFSYMTKNSMCIATGGGIKILTGNKLEDTKGLMNSLSQKFYREDLMHANRLSFCTVMFRRDALNLEMMKTLKDSPHLDWPIYMILFKKEKGVYLRVFSDVFSAYRIHSGGVYSGVAEEKRRNNVIKTMKFNNAIFNEPISEHYYLLYEKYLMDPNLPVPKINELLYKFNLDKGSLLSFYMQVYGKKRLINILFKNIQYLPLLSGMIIIKIIRRYF